MFIYFGGDDLRKDLFCVPDCTICCLVRSVFPSSAIWEEALSPEHGPKGCTWCRKSLLRAHRGQKGPPPVAPYMQLA